MKVAKGLIFLLCRCFSLLEHTINSQSKVCKVAYTEVEQLTRSAKIIVIASHRMTFQSIYTM